MIFSLKEILKTLSNTASLPLRHDQKGDVTFLPILGRDIREDALSCNCTGCVDRCRGTRTGRNETKPHPLFKLNLRAGERTHVTNKQQWIRPVFKTGLLCCASSTFCFPVLRYVNTGSQGYVSTGKDTAGE